MNTPEKNTFRYIVFKDGKTWYSVALELNIVESGDDPKLAFFTMLQAVSGYVDSFKKIKGARYRALNQSADPEYEKMWKNIHAARPVATPYMVDMYGVSVT